MLILQGTLRAATILGGGTNRKSGEIIPERPVLQVETTDGRGLVEMHTITVPSVEGFGDKIGKVVNLPVRAWAPGAKVAYAFEKSGAPQAPATVAASGR